MSAAKLSRDVSVGEKPQNRQSVCFCIGFWLFDDDDGLTFTLRKKLFQQCTWFSAK